MIRFVALVLVALVACERTGDPHEIDVAARIAALDRLRLHVATTPRERSPVEAPVAYTNAYVGFELAYGYARLGAAKQAADLVAASRAALADVASDPVHAYLIAAFAARVDQATAHERLETPLPPEVATELVGLDRVNRYKVDRLREASTVLEPLERPDAIGAFSKNKRDVRGGEVEVLQGTHAPAARAIAVARIVSDAAATTGEDRADLLSGALDALVGLPASSAIDLDRAWPLVAGVPAPRQAVLYAKAIVAAEHFRRADVVPRLVALLGHSLDETEPPAAAWAIRTTLRVTRRVDAHRELTSLVAGWGPPGGLAAVARGGAQAQLGEPLPPAIAHARAELDKPMNLSARLELTEALASAYANTATDAALPKIEALLFEYATMTDSFGTNSHYCLSVIELVDALVRGITGEG